ncbi:MAG: KEOPS complex N(6)-L-threonylcarbamoyladenine synthase Kae1 [archaeon]
MLCLGIETTAHTFGISLVDGTRQGKDAILCNVKDVYKTEQGGMIPSELADHHVAVSQKVLRQALDVASEVLKKNLTVHDIDCIAFSNAPGIGNALRVGGFVARYLSVITNKPLVPVNHCIAHLEIARLVTPAKDPVLLYASGANTQVIAYDAGKYRIFGETLDMGIGNFLDSFGRLLGMGFPAGPTIQQYAEKAVEQKLPYVPLPYSVKGMDVSFGGMFTNLKRKIAEKAYTPEQLCYSAQETAFAMLLEVSERAMAHCQKNELILGGGVACNTRLKEMAKLMCEARNATGHVPDNEFLVDNAAMIAWTGLVMFKAGIFVTAEKADINPYERTDDVVVTWR